MTGAGRGIGRAIARQLASAGAAVALLSRTQAEVEAVADGIRRLGGRAVALTGDVARSTDVSAALEATEATLGEVDVLVNNAGILHRCPFLDITEAEWSEVIAVNLTGCFLVARAVARRMIERQRGGCVINIGSIESAIALPDQASYVASKGGLRMLTKAMALEWAPHGITVNGVGPGVIDTGMSPLGGSDYGRWLIASIPMDRPGRPEEVATVVQFLASEDARHITGTMVYVDGGWLLR